MLLRNTRVRMTTRWDKSDHTPNSRGVCLSHYIEIKWAAEDALDEKNTYY